MIIFSDPQIHAKLSVNSFLSAFSARKPLLIPPAAKENAPSVSIALQDGAFFCYPTRFMN